ncbi:hypothetical protein V7S43_018752 [Phytophthora oleae]|uniref:HTH myb-type domain-containing protein n=1 Tax=Phytophthora oleae TaxID=2107226 RepID=A0ABD3EPP2_9STRA
MQELFAVRQVLHYLPDSQSTEKGWTPHEQRLFWVALTKFPKGPWTDIAEYIGTKTTRQAMTHAQKLRQKLNRWNSRLRSNPDVNSLMDSVTSDGNVTVSANAVYETASRSASFEPPLSSSMGLFETKADGQQGVSSSPAISWVSNQQDDHMGTLLPNSSPQTIERGEVLTNTPHDFLDELAKTFSEEDTGEEITEEELKELDDEQITD